MFAKHLLAALLPFYIAAVNAANDWSLPCTSGICEWDTKNEDTTGNVIVTAATSALSDVTTASGWHILDCDPNSIDQQTIRLVCESANAEEAGCDALHEGGAENTVVRLPNSCGAGPFARLVRIWDSPDQKIPDETRKKFRKRDTTAPGPVQNAIIDFDFSKVPPKPGNEVEIQVKGSNNPLAPVKEKAAQLRRAYSSQKMRRELLRKPKPSSAPAPAPAAKKPSNDLVKEFLQQLGDLNKVGVAIAKNNRVDTQKTGQTVANATLGCEATETRPGFTAALDLTVDVDLRGVVSYGFAVEGKLVPPKLDDVGYYAAFTGNASALWHLTTTAEVELHTKRIEVANIPLSPLSIPGVVNIGPKFSLGVSGVAKFALTGKMDIGTALAIPKIEMRYPPKQAGPSTGTASLAKDQPATKLDVTPQIGFNGTFEGHLTPRLALGLDMFNGFAKTEIFMEADIKGAVDLGISAEKNLEKPKGKSTSVSACAGLTAGIGARAGAEGEIFPFFDKTVAIDIFNKDFELFKKCLAPGQTASASASASSKPAAPTATKPASPKTPAPPKVAVPAVVAPKKASARSLHSREEDDDNKLECPTVLSTALNLISISSSS